MQVKIRILLVSFFLLFVALIVRLVYWQVVKAGTLSGDAQRQYSSSTVTNAPRGNILASDGSYWVIRDNAWLIFANTNLMNKSANDAAISLAPLLVDDPTNSDQVQVEKTKLFDLLSKQSSYIPLKQKVADEVKNNVQALNFDGINFEGQETRFYPEASAAAQILGFVGKD